MKNDIVNILKSFPTLEHLPDHELQWLVNNGEIKHFKPGIIAEKGTRIDQLWIILKGHMVVRIDSGAGAKVANSEIYAGSVTAMLPYSRLQALPGNAYAEEETELLSISTSLFTKMINKCPLFTAHTVHTMIDRTRIYNTSALQDEKMISIGKLAAGLAHELNNPAAATIRNVKLLRENQTNADTASRMLNKAGLDEKQFAKIESMSSMGFEISTKTTLSPLQKSDLLDKIADWLQHNNVDTIYAGPLIDLAISTEDLDGLLNTLSGDIIETALKWIVANCSIHILSNEIEQATNQIFNLVDAVKKFSYMDNLAENELIDVESGIVDSLRVLDSKSKSKNADIKLEIEKDLPSVCANGAELNQVWFSLLDNALDAIPDSGTIHVRVNMETNFLVVRISDNGPGIPSEQINRIFDPFYTTKPPGQGTGLGLDFSRKLIRRYKGDIYVRSVPGKTEFCVNLIPDNS